MKAELEDKEVKYVRGKVAGDDVLDDEGRTIVARGQTITDEVTDRARDAGKLHLLMLSAAAFVVEAGGEQARRRLEEFRGVTEGHEAEFVRGRPAGHDVRDFQGNTVVREGDTVTDDVIERAQREGLLQELVLAVGAPGFHMEEEKAEEVERPAAKMGYKPYFK